MAASAQKPSEPAQVSVPSPWIDNMARLFRRKLTSEADILKLVHSGLSDAIYAKVTRHLRLPKDAIGAETTIRNRLKSRSRLNADETERLLRLGRVYAMARSLFGSDERTVIWLHKPAHYLLNTPPIAPVQLATRDAGVRLLEEKLLRTAHGTF